MRKYVRQTRAPGIRVQLTLWYTAIFALLILLFSLIFYTTLQAFLASGVDSALQLRAQQIAGGVTSESGKIVIADVTGELPGLDATPTLGEQGTSTAETNQTGQQGARSDVNIGTLVRMLDVKGQTAYISPAFRSRCSVGKLHSAPAWGVLARHGDRLRWASGACV